MSCRRSARRRWTSTASTSSATRPSSGASSRCASTSPIDDTVQILRGLRGYEAHHRCKISDDALHAAASLADRYIQDRHLPDKAIDLIDEAGLRIRTMSAPPRYRELEEEIEKVRSDKEASIEAQEFEKAALRDGQADAEEGARGELAQRGRRGAAGVGEDEIADIVSMWTGSRSSS